MTKKRTEEVERVCTIIRDEFPKYKKVTRYMKKIIIKEQLAKIKTDINPKLIKSILL